jgi:hypothetical protein
MLFDETISITELILRWEVTLVNNNEINRNGIKKPQRQNYTQKNFVWVTSNGRFTMHFDTT